MAATQTSSPRCKTCARAAGWVSVCGNVLLAVVKWVVGLTCNSQALVADALHSTVDVLGSCITLVMLKLSQRKPSSRYPYGLGKLEDVAAVAIYLILVGAGTAILVDAVHSIAVGHMLTPKPPAMVAAILSIGVNAFMYYFISCAGKKANSPSLSALGYENKVDALSSIAALIGIIGATFGLTPLDPAAAIVVSGIIIVESLRELYGTAMRLTDSALPATVRREIERLALSVPHVNGVLALRTRRLGATAHADLDILVDADISVDVAASIATAVETRLRVCVPDLESVHVYAHPAHAVAEGRSARLLELLSVMGELRTHRPGSGGRS